MSRRKGEITSAAIDRGWPHQVALAGTTVRANFVQIERRSRELGTAPRHHGYRRDHEDFIVYCFADEDPADIFAQAYDGQRMDPDTRPRWPARPSPKEARELRAAARRQPT
ncbi:hypothetical protein ACO2I3_19395 [Leptospira interrogans]